MDLELQPGKYVVAVSGGVDSAVLLHLLAQQGAKYDLVVAHFDHGIRTDSTEDRRLVAKVAYCYGLPCVYREGKLGARASEATARAARYAFLHEVRQASSARAIVTAHHQDDLLETIILNLQRGTGRRGLASLKNTDVIKRPLLYAPKKQLLRYAEREGLSWREDSTNQEETYLRNYIRKNIMPRLADTDREALLAISHRTHELNDAITEQASNYLHEQPHATQLARHQFIMLPHAVAREIMAEWLRTRIGAELSRSMLERLVLAAKTGRVGSKVDINAGHWLVINKTTLALELRER